MTPTAVLGQVHMSLRALEAALMSGRADRVLDAERPLAEAAASLAAMVAATPRGSVTDGGHVRRLAGDIQRSIQRARALGAASSDLVSAMLPPGTYGPRGLQPPTAWSSATVTTRT
jgi:hypothetical protein